MPVEYSDLAPNIQIALDMYNKLPDTYTGGQISTYSGKNTSPLALLFDIYLIEDELSRAEITETIMHIDIRNVKLSMARAEKQLKKK